MSQEPLQVASVKDQVDIGILTVREDEFAAVLARFPDRRPLEGGRNRYELASVQTARGQTITVAITRILEQGQGKAQAVAHDLINDLDPAWVFLVGIAGGVPSDEFTLGDVLLASRVYDFSVSASLQSEPDQYCRWKTPPPWREGFAPASTKTRPAPWPTAAPACLTLYAWPLAGWQKRGLCLYKPTSPNWPRRASGRISSLQCWS